MLCYAAEGRLTKLKNSLVSRTRTRVRATKLFFYSLCKKSGYRLRGQRFNFDLRSTSPGGWTGDRLFRKHPRDPCPPGKNFSKSWIFFLTSFCKSGIMGNMGTRIDTNLQIENKSNVRACADASLTGQLPAWTICVSSRAGPTIRGSDMKSIVLTICLVLFLSAGCTAPEKKTEVIDRKTNLALIFGVPEIWAEVQDRMIEIESEKDIEKFRKSNQQNQ